MTVVINEQYSVFGTGGGGGGFTAATPFTATGTTTARSSANRAADFWNIQDFAAVSDGTSAGAGTDNSAAFTAAITAAHAVYVSSGKRVYISLANGIYAFGSSVSMLSGVYIVGPGTVVTKGASTYTGALRPIFKGQTITDVGFLDVTSYGVGPDRKIAGGCTDTSPVGGRDCFFDADTVTDLIIDRCFLYRHQDTISVSNPTNYRITNNYVDSLSAKTLAQLDAGTFTPYTFTGDPGEGITICGSRAGLNYGPSNYGVISNNIVCIVGLDIAINIASQSGYPRRIQVTGNVAMGANAGIQTYTSGVAVPDPGTLTTTDMGVSIVGNTCVLTYQQGIYIRGVEGVTCNDNAIIRCAIIGTFVGASAGGICARETTNATFPTSPVHHDLPNLICNNRIIDCGNPTTGVCDSGMRVDALHFLAEGNQIYRSVDRFGANILASNSIAIQSLDTGTVAQPLSGVYRGNHVRGFNVGISIGYAGATFSALGAGMSMAIENNVIASVATGVLINAKASGYHVNGNKVSECSSTGIYLKNAPYSEICRNFIEGAPIGIQLASGSLATDFYGVGGRQGQTLIVDANQINGATTPISIIETGSGDGSARSRCISCKGNVIDGAQFWRDTNSFTVTAAPTSSDYHNWYIGDQIPHRTPTTATPSGWICSVAGSFGAAITQTATTTSGSATVTFSALAPIPVGAYITIAGVTGAKKIISVNTGALTAVMDSTASASVAGAAVAYSAPTFLAMANFT